MAETISAALRRRQTEQKIDLYYRETQSAIYRRTDTFFGYLLIVQWVAEIIAVLIVSPRTWIGTNSQVHVHLWAAVFLGGAVSLFPAFLAFYRPGHSSTRHIITAAQMLTSGLLIHFTGGRLETHFHVFGSLALIAFYRDWRLFLTATAVVGADHLLRGIYFPLSVYGIAYSTIWRSMEHVGWVLFENTFLVWSCRISNSEMREVAKKRAELERLNKNVESIVVDRTQELVEAQASLVEREAEMRAILRAAADGIITLDDNTVIMSANDAAERLFEYTREELLGKNMYELLNDRSRKIFRELFTDFEHHPLDEKKTAHVELLIVSKHGRILTVEMALSAMELGSRRMFTAIVRDVSQRRLLEMQLSQAQKLESIGQLAAGIAHEINTPIQFVGDNTRFFQDEFSNIRKLLDGCDKLMAAFKHGQECTAIIEEVEAISKTTDAEYLYEQIPRAIQQSLDGIGRVSRIVRAMKEFSHPGATEKQATDLNKIIESTVIVSTNEWKYVADVAMQFDPALPLVQLLPGDFNQVILNLLVNSAHAIADVKNQLPAGKGQITISTKKIADWAEIRIQDSGTGIPKDVASKVYDPFFTTKEVGKGTGQGLAIARSIVVDKHGGTISFESEAGKGTTFIITLPLREGASAGPGPQQASVVGVM